VYDMRQHSSSTPENVIMPQLAGKFIELLQRVRQGDPEAIATLAQEYEHKVRLAARALLGPDLRRQLDSVDIAQSVHLTLLAGLREDRFKPAGPAALVALALTLVRRKIARRWRRACCDRRFRSAVAELDPRAVAACASLCQSPVDPQRAVSFQEEMQHFWRSLNITERCLMELRIQGYETAEISAELGLAPNVVRVLLSRVRRRLHQQGIFSDWC
jgi:RNA polymerase sigma-70 factor (ECF subfamily)